MRMGQWGQAEGHSLATQGLSQTAGLGQEANPARQARMAVAEVMEAGMHSPWKTKLSHWPGLRDNFSAEGETQPSPSA